MSENFAGFFAFTDHEVGRLLDAVKQLPDADNTLIIYITGDNDASSEGGPDGTLNEIKMLNGQPTSISTGPGSILTYSLNRAASLPEGLGTSKHRFHSGSTS